MGPKTIGAKLAPSQRHVFFGCDGCTQPAHLLATEFFEGFEEKQQHVFNSVGSGAWITLQSSRVHGSLQNATHIHIHTHTYTHTHTHTAYKPCLQVNTHTHTQRVQALSAGQHTHTHTQTHTYTPHSHSHTHIYIYIYTHIHTYTHHTHSLTHTHRIKTKRRCGTRALKLAWGNLTSFGTNFMFLGEDV